MTINDLLSPNELKALGVEDAAFDVKLSFFTRDGVHHRDDGSCGSAYPGSIPFGSSVNDLVGEVCLSCWQSYAPGDPSQWTELVEALETLEYAQDQVQDAGEVSSVSVLELHSQRQELQDALDSVDDALDPSTYTSPPLHLAWATSIKEAAESKLALTDAALTSDSARTLVGTHVLLQAALVKKVPSALVSWGVPEEVATSVLAGVLSDLLDEPAVTSPSEVVDALLRANLLPVPLESYRDRLPSETLRDYVLAQQQEHYLHLATSFLRRVRSEVERLMAGPLMVGVTSINHGSSTSKDQVLSSFTVSSQGPLHVVVAPKAIFSRVLNQGVSRAGRPLPLLSEAVLETMLCLWDPDSKVFSSLPKALLAAERVQVSA